MGYKDVMVVIIVNTVFTVIAFNNVITAIASVLLCRLVCYTNRVKIWLALQGEIFKENLSVALLSWSSFLTNCCINFCFFCKTNFATKSCQEQSEEETVTWHHCYQSTFCFPPPIAAQFHAVSPQMCRQYTSHPASALLFRPGGWDLPPLICQNEN